MKNCVKPAEELVAPFKTDLAEDNTLKTVGKATLFRRDPAAALKLPHAGADKNAGRLDEVRLFATDALSTEDWNFSHLTEKYIEHLFSGQASN